MLRSSTSNHDLSFGARRTRTREPSTAAKINRVWPALNFPSQKNLSSSSGNWNNFRYRTESWRSCKLAYFKNFSIFTSHVLLCWTAFRTSDVKIMSAFFHKSKYDSVQGLFALLVQIKTLKNVARAKVKTSRRLKFSMSESNQTAFSFVVQKSYDFALQIALHLNHNTSHCPLASLLPYTFKNS